MLHLTLILYDALFVGMEWKRFARNAKKYLLASVGELNHWEVKMPVLKFKAVDMVFDYIPDHTDQLIEDVMIRIEIPENQVNKIYNMFTEKIITKESSGPDIKCGCILDKKICGWHSNGVCCKL